MHIKVFGLIALLAAGACSGQGMSSDAAEVEPSPYNTDVDVAELMIHVVDPSARAFWAGWGEVLDDAGLHDVSAQTDEEWKRVEDGAATVVIATNTLMLPSYRRQPEAEWVKWATEVARISMEGKFAAEDQNVLAMEDIGGRLDVACDGCHDSFRIED